MDLIYLTSSRKADADIIEQITEGEKKLIAMRKKNQELANKISTREKTYNGIHAFLLGKLRKIEEQIALFYKHL